jgi:hypothetical protein
LLYPSQFRLLVSDARAGLLNRLAVSRPGCQSALRGPGLLCAHRPLGSLLLSLSSCDTRCRVLSGSLRLLLVLCLSRSRRSISRPCHLLIGHNLSLAALDIGILGGKLGESGLLLADVSLSGLL